MEKSKVKRNIIIIAAVLGIIFVGVFCAGWRFDYQAGSHRILPTAIDKDFFGNYKVYYKTSEYTRDNEENVYYIEKKNKDLADKMTGYIRAGEEVIVTYDRYIGFKGIGAPHDSPITEIEKVGSQ